MATKTALTIYKKLLRELSTNNMKFSYRSLPIYLKIKDEYRRHRPITAKHCKPNDEVLFVASTYATYLESVRQRKIIHQTYSKGEKSIQQAANIVGLELPKPVDRPYLPLNEMNSCDAKQKAFAQRVYFDLKICRKWPKLSVYFDENTKWIFFLGKSSDDQPLTFVLPISSDEEFTVDDLFNLRKRLSSALPSNINEDISSVLMAIIANDFTLGYFNFSYGLPSLSLSNSIIQTEISNNQMVTQIDNDFTNEIRSAIINNEWPENDTDTAWD